MVSSRLGTTKLGGQPLDDLRLRIPSTTASMLVSDFHNDLDASKLSALLIRNLHEIVLGVTQRGSGDSPVGSGYVPRTVGVHILINDDAVGQGLLYGGVANVLQGIQMLEDPLKPKECMFESGLDQPVTYGYLILRGTELAGWSKLGSNSESWWLEKRSERPCRTVLISRLFIPLHTS